MKKKSSTIDVPNDDSGKGDDRFCRFEYWGIGSYFLVHYVGDCTVFGGFCHRNSKDTIKSFVRSAPHVKEKVRILTIIITVMLQSIICLVHTCHAYYPISCNL